MIPPIKPSLFIKVLMNIFDVIHIEYRFVWGKKRKIYDITSK